MSPPVKTAPIRSHNRPRRLGAPANAAAAGGVQGVLEAFGVGGAAVAAVPGGLGGQLARVAKPSAHRRRPT
jgi:hypothetical protein